MEKQEQTFQQKLENEPVKTGKIYRVINPENGADIICHLHIFGEGFYLKRGETIDVDETIAKSAAHLWQFLKIEPIAKTRPSETVLVHHVNSIKDGYEYPDYAEKDERVLDCEKYAFHVLQLLLKDMDVEASHTLSKDSAYEILEETPYEQLMEGLKALRVPAYFK